MMTRIENALSSQFREKAKELMFGWNIRPYDRMRWYCDSDKEMAKLRRMFLENAIYCTPARLLEPMFPGKEDYELEKQEGKSYEELKNKYRDCIQRWNAANEELDTLYRVTKFVLNEACLQKESSGPGVGFDTYQKKVSLIEHHLLFLKSELIRPYLQAAEDFLRHPNNLKRLTHDYGCVLDDWEYYSNEELTNRILFELCRSFRCESANIYIEHPDWLFYYCSIGKSKNSALFHAGMESLHLGVCRRNPKIESVLKELVWRQKELCEKLKELDLAEEQNKKEQASDC